jgi:regulatory protein
MVGSGLSLKGRALRLLSQREHSRLELVRKLAPHAESRDQLDRLLDELERENFHSEQRFAESLARRRAERFGLRRIEQELGTHRLDGATTEAVLAPLRQTERERASAVWKKRFGSAPTDPRERARQQRFLAQRGFTSEAIGGVLRQAGSRSDSASTEDIDPPPAVAADDAPG